MSVFKTAKSEPYYWSTSCSTVVRFMAYKMHGSQRS